MPDQDQNERQEYVEQFPHEFLFVPPGENPLKSLVRFLWTIDLTIWGKPYESRAIEEWEICHIYIGDLDYELLKYGFDRFELSFRNCQPEKSFFEVIQRFYRIGKGKLYGHKFLTCKIMADLSLKGSFSYAYGAGINPIVDNAISDLLKYVFNYLKSLELHYISQGLSPRNEKADITSFQFLKQFEEEDIKNLYDYLVNRKFIDGTTEKHWFIKVFIGDSIPLGNRINWVKSKKTLADFITTLGNYMSENADYFKVAQHCFTFRNSELGKNFHNNESRGEGVIHPEIEPAIKHLTGKSFL